MRFPHVAARVFDTPLLIAPAKLQAVLGVLGPRLGFDLSAEGGAKLLYDEDEDYDGRERKPYWIENGVARIPIYGTLIHRLDWMDALSGLTSYQQISSALQAALADPLAASIVLDIDSSGGEVPGCFDLADEVFAARGVKPIVAVANEYAMSGAYLIGSAADELVIAQTGLAGSVGVVWTHLDVSEANKMRGVAVTHLYAGAHKIDGTPHKPLTAGAKRSIQADVDKIYGMFVAAVARNRSLDADAVIATEAEIYRGDDAVAIGFADRVGTLKETMEQLAESSRPPAIATTGTRAVSAQTQRSAMTNKQTGAAGGEPAANASASEQRSQAAAIDVEAIHREAAATATTAAITAERARIRAITASPEAEGRAELAAHLAFETDMSAEQAKELLAKAPKATEAKGNPFEAAMNKVANPQVGADAAAGTQGGDEAEATRLAANIVALHRGPAKQAQG